MSHTTSIKVRGYHLDVYQHVNNARYLEFLEEARWAYFEDAGDIDYCMSRGIAFVLVNMNINYRIPAVMGHTLQIHTQATSIGQKSAVFHQKIYIEGTDKLVTDADLTFVLVDMKTNKAMPIEGDIRERFEKHLSDRPE